jgi:hypothetical protein
MMRAKALDWSADWSASVSLAMNAKREPKIATGTVALQSKNRIHEASRSKASFGRFRVISWIVSAIKQRDNLADYRSL